MWANGSKKILFYYSFSWFWSNICPQMQNTLWFQLHKIGWTKVGRHLYILCYICDRHFSLFCRFVHSTINWIVGKIINRYNWKRAQGKIFKLSVQPTNLHQRYSTYKDEMSQNMSQLSKMIDLAIHWSCQHHVIWLQRPSGAHADVCAYLYLWRICRVGLADLWPPPGVWLTVCSWITAGEDCLLGRIKPSVPLTFSVIFIAVTRADGGRSNVKTVCVDRLAWNNGHFIPAHDSEQQLYQTWKFKAFKVFLVKFNVWNW